MTPENAPEITTDASTLPSAPTTRVVMLEDVRAALGETPATATNAGVVRKALGRGSLSTIQKHLDTLRSEASAPAQAPDAQVEPVPAQLAAALWSHALASARAAVGMELAQAQARALKAEDALAVARADCAAALAQADQDAVDRAQAEVALHAVQEQAKVQALRHEATLSALRAEIDRLVVQRSTSA